MRKTFNLLFICLIALYGWIGYQVIHTTDLPQCQPEGSLSDVAEEVIAIPLKTNGHCSLNKIKMIKRDREDIFLVSDRQLYHFNSSGQFLGQITAHLPGTRQPVELVDYAVDPVHDRLVVIGTGHEVYYYDYDGQLLFQSILPQDASWKTFGTCLVIDIHSSQIGNIQLTITEDYAKILPLQIGTRFRRRYLLCTGILPK